MGIIYVITNDINNKQYVGQTIIPLEKRFQRHILDAKRNVPGTIHHFQRAIQKYGEEHFFIQVLEECPDENLNEKEKYWINKLDTYNNGYNSTLGGDGTCSYDYDFLVQEFLKYHNISETARAIGCDRHTIQRALQARKIKSPISGFYGKEKLSNKIAKYDKQGNIIQIYLSQRDAAKSLFEDNIITLSWTKERERGVAGHLGRAAKGIRKTAYGYIWKYI